jgi:hypothetical protein
MLFHPSLLHSLKHGLMNSKGSRLSIIQMPFAIQSHLTELAAVPAVHTMATPIVEQSASVLALDLLTVGAPDVVRMRALAHIVANLRARGHPNAVAAIDALDALAVLALKILGTGALAAANATVAA